MTIGKRRQLQGRSLLAAVALTIALLLIPIQTETTRTLLILGLFSSWAGGLLFFWRSVVLRIVFFLPVLVVGALAFLPYRIADVGALRGAYVTALQRYEGTRYLWGGEGGWGIDCSGLVRRGLIDACLEEGWRTRDLGLLRTAAALWWYDSSAAALGQEYQGRTHLLAVTASLNTLDASTIAPGDLAVTEDGKHILAFLGEKRWIEAEPREGRVTIVTTPSDEVYFSQPMRLMRWYRLQ